MLHYFSFHLEDPPFGIKVVAKNDQLLNDRGKLILELGGDSEASDSDQLQFPFVHLSAGNEQVKNLAGEEDRPLAELELQLDLEKPVHQNEPHALANLGLIREGMGSASRVLVGLVQPVEDILTVLFNWTVVWPAVPPLRVVDLLISVASVLIFLVLRGWLFFLLFGVDKLLEGLQRVDFTWGPFYVHYA